MQFRVAALLSMHHLPRSVDEMITVSKLKLYQKYDGDLDGLSRSSCRDNALDSIEDDWRTIEKLRSGLWSIQKVPCAQSYRDKIKKELASQTADEETRNLLMEIALNPK